jgi:cellulose synthase/poly-beta-1,6-N-acetylglucosamine synthase-like glycosyltransferase
MSSLVHLPSGDTLDYWWEEMRGRVGRKRFILTKVLEVIAYKAAKTGRVKTRHPKARSILELQPIVLRNGVTSQTRPVVVIPAKCSTESQADLLRQTVVKVLDQAATVIVVNDGSQLWPQLPRAVQVLNNPTSKGPAASRNQALDAALNYRADVVLFTDSDCIPESNWVSEAIKGFVENPYIHCLSGRTDSSNSTWFDKYHEINGTLNGRCFKRTKILLYGPTCNLAISRQIAEDFRFDESFPNAACEDIDFCFRLMQQGFRTIHRQSMVVKHDYQYEHGRFVTNAGKFVKQFRKYARAEAILLAKFPDYYPHFGQTEEIGRFKIPGISHRQNEMPLRSAL